MPKQSEIHSANNEIERLEAKIIKLQDQLIRVLLEKRYPPVHIGVDFADKEPGGVNYAES